MEGLNNNALSILAGIERRQKTANTAQQAAFKKFTSPQWQDKWLKLDRSNPEVQRMADEVQQFCGRFFRRQDTKRLILTGTPFTGKTHCAEAAYKYTKAVSIEAWSQGHWDCPPRALWVEWGAICMRNSTEFANWLNSLDEPRIDLLFIEDVGSEVDQFKSGMPTENLRLVLEHFKDRYTFLTTNVPPGLWKTKWDERVASRFYRDSTIIAINIEPYGKRKS